MSSQSEKQIVTMHILPISQDVMTMKFGQLIEYNKINFFFKNLVENETGRLAPDLFLFFKKALYEVKASGL